MEAGNEGEGEGEREREREEGEGEEGRKGLVRQCSRMKRREDWQTSSSSRNGWGGASRQARFGFDIGGTLCKIVYFEPLSVGPEEEKEEKKEGKKEEEMLCTEVSHQVENSLSHAKQGCKEQWEVPHQQNISHLVEKIWESVHDPVHLSGCGTLYFKCFETWRMEEFLALTKEHSLLSGNRALGATGGGARKFGNRFLEIAGLHLHRVDELKCLVRGMDFLVQHSQQEFYDFPVGSFKGGVIQRPLKSPESSSDDAEDESLDETINEELKATVLRSGEKKKASKRKTCILPKSPVPSAADGEWLDCNKSLYPILVVNIGSGVSILKVDSPDAFYRVGGTSLGGSTFYGLASILTGCNSFEELIALAAEGDSTQIDMLVGDIYGGDYSEMGLAATTVASSFGKLVHPTKRGAAEKTPQHLAKATLLMITNNIGSIAMLHARSTNVDRVMFTGSFLHENKLAIRLLAVAMEFWSKGQIKAVFLRHEGHAGAMGALLNELDPNDPIDALLLSGSFIGTNSL